MDPNRRENVVIGNKYYTDEIGTEVTMFTTFKGKYEADDDVVNINASSTVNIVKIAGNSENNVINGGTKADSLYGGAGNDELYGGTGNDTLNGGAGSDTLTGGAGKDVFVYEGGNDVITDYTAGEDKIRLTNSQEIKSYEFNSDYNKLTFNIGTVGNAATTGTIELDLETAVTSDTGIAVTVVNYKGKATTTTYYAPEEEQQSAKTIDLLYDNNFLTEDVGIDDVSAISDSKYSVGDIETDTANGLETDTKVAYGTDEENK